MLEPSLPVIGGVAQLRIGYRYSGRQDEPESVFLMLRSGIDAANCVSQSFLSRYKGLPYHDSRYQGGETVEKNASAYRWGKERITSSPDVLSGEPVFRGTRIPLEHVAALFRKNIPEEEIAEDFPALDAKDLQYARLAARFGAPPGRPKKPLRIDREHWRAVDSLICWTNTLQKLVT